MSARLKIGSYVIDAAETGSTSTTAGCRLLFGDSLEGGTPLFEWREGRASGQLVFVVQVAGVALKAARDALSAAVTKTINADVVLESAAGTTVKDWKVSDGSWQRVTGEVVVNEGDAAGLVLVVLTFERAGLATGSAGDVAGSLDGPVWSFMFESQGKASVVGTCVFNTRTNAAAWVQGMRAGTAWPAWMNTTTTRFVTAGYPDMPQQPNAADPVPDSAYTPVRATVVMNMLPAAWAADASFTDVVDGDCEMSVRPRARRQREAGSRPGYDVLITGRLVFKTEQDTTFDPNDTTVEAANGMKARARACFNVMKADLETRYGTVVELQESPEFTPSGKTGEWIFAALGTADFDGIYDFRDNVTFERSPGAVVLEGDKGSVVMAEKLGPTVRCFRSGAARTTFLFTPAPLTFLQDGTWLELKWRPSKPVVMPPQGEGPTVYEITWEGEWLKLKDGSDADVIAPLLGE